MTLPGDQAPPVHAGFTSAFLGAPLDAIKLAAAGLMVLDHVNTVLLDGRATWMWRLGRVAFPLFCFALAVHLLRGREPGRQLGLLLAAGVVTQPFYAAAFNYGSKEANILFTLAGGAALAAWLDGRPALVRHAALALGLGAILAFPQTTKTGVDFGLPGLLIPVAMLCALRQPLAFGPWLLAALFALNLTGWHPRGETPLAAATMDCLTILAAGGVLIAASLALRSRPRFLPRYALHAFYPAHLGLLAALRALGVGGP
ncbi:MAG TPA: TraX family protein [Beijerinckiaceae bacterium]|jgi:hypothetical protein